MKELLLRQYKRYPLMQIQDMVKFIYQNEFAGGHLIKNSMDSLQRLEEEYSAMEDAGALPNDGMFGDIGNGLCRFYLTGLKNSGLNIATVNRFFVNTANLIHGSIDGFENKLNVLRQCCKEKSLPFSLEEVNRYLLDYKKRGYPPVSHSDAYRTAYSPFYRIVKMEYVHFLKVFQEIDALLSAKQKILIAIGRELCVWEKHSCFFDQ